MTCVSCLQNTYSHIFVLSFDLSISSPVLSVITSQNHTCCRCRRLTILVCYTYTLCLLLDQLLAFVFTLYNSACFDVCSYVALISLNLCAGRCCQNNGLLTTRPKASVHHFSNWSCFYNNPSPRFRVWWCGYI